MVTRPIYTKKIKNLQSKTSREGKTDISPIQLTENNWNRAVVNIIKFKFFNQKNKGS
jgi:hypothetical protein